MIWFFEKHGEYIRYETRTAASGPGFELLLTRPDGSEVVEYFADSADLTRRQRVIEAEMAAQGWTGPHGRTF